MSDRILAVIVVVGFYIVFAFLAGIMNAGTLASDCAQVNKSWIINPFTLGTTGACVEKTR